MNAAKIREATKLLREALSEPGDVTEAQWAEFGRAVDAAVRDRYSIVDVVTKKVCSDNWRASALRLWHAAEPLGLHGHSWE